jgi:alpha-L-rhamnosidase
MWEKMSVAGAPEPYLPTPVSAKLPGGALPVSPGSTSLAHGWSTGPASALSAFVLGIRPLAPGFARWVIAPQASGLRWAQGQVPSPHGALVSRWIRGRRYFRLTIVAPRGTAGTVVLPRLGRAGSAFIDGRLAWPGGRAGAAVRVIATAGTISFENVRGTHTFLWLA